MLTLAHVSSVPHSHSGLFLLGAVVALLLVTAAVFRFARGATHG